jgi:hypothetical protein
MNVAERMLRTHPQESENAELLAAAIDACFDCTAACTSCADACLAEDGVAELVRCIGTNQDCADVSAATGAVLSRPTASDDNLTAAILAACVTACSTCADECESHSDMYEHCRVCAEVCRRCQKACRALLVELA